MIKKWSLNYWLEDNFLKLQFNVNGEVQIIHEQMNVQMKVNYDHSENQLLK